MSKPRLRHIISCNDGTVLSVAALTPRNTGSLGWVRLSLTSQAQPGRMTHGWKKSSPTVKQKRQQPTKTAVEQKKVTKRAAVSPAIIDIVSPDEGSESSDDHEAPVDVSLDRLDAIWKEKRFVCVTLLIFLA
ncbi:hypothetical protein RvY_14226 [Ramazzottius varieornatus]|uniref:Uncharacterized protein n=1 Tax=Ramazzottius varieornatus TaxID=947166 RepID=A0A1D1VQL1_RAMVA|nr:hypothetical protein RvY_14226 [Ramazzottius varieornatus]